MPPNQSTGKNGVCWPWRRKFSSRRIFFILALMVISLLTPFMLEAPLYESFKKTSFLSTYVDKNSKFSVRLNCFDSSFNDDGDALPRAVILILADGKVTLSPLFLTKMLPLLEKNFLLRYPYPVHIFHEGISNGDIVKVKRAIPSARKVGFENVSSIWRNLPKGVSEKKLVRWMNAPKQRRYHRRGYRIMCRFWAGLVWQLPSLDSYEYYWRLDTDSFLTKPVPCDIFQLMRANECVYGYRWIQPDNEDVVKELWPTFLRWAFGVLSLGEIQYIKDFATNNGTYSRIMYYNNFELGKISLKRHPLYQSMFRALDEKEPRGMMRYRWGDAPIHTLGVEVVMYRERWRKCFFDPKFAGYLHGRNVI